VKVGDIVIFDKNLASNDWWPYISSGPHRVRLVKELQKGVWLFLQDVWSDEFEEDTNKLGLKLDYEQFCSYTLVGTAMDTMFKEME
jgi:hypothetical protein